MYVKAVRYDLLGFEYDLWILYFFLVIFFHQMESINLPRALQEPGDAD